LSSRIKGVPRLEAVPATKEVFGAAKDLLLL